MQSTHVLITGGASGIGLATAQRFREDNFKVTLVDVVECNRQAEEIGAHSVALDVRDERAIENLATQLDLSLIHI